MGRFPVGALIGAMLTLFVMLKLTLPIVDPLPRTGILSEGVSQAFFCGFMGGGLLAWGLSQEENPEWMKSLWKALCSWAGLTAFFAPTVSIVMAMFYGAIEREPALQKLPHPALRVYLVQDVPCILIGALLIVMLCREIMNSQKREISLDFLDGARTVFLPGSVHKRPDFEVVSKLAPDQLRELCGASHEFKPKSRRSLDGNYAVEIKGERMSISSKSGRSVSFEGALTSTLGGSKIRGHVRFLHLRLAFIIAFLVWLAISGFWLALFQIVRRTTVSPILVVTVFWLCAQFTVFLNRLMLERVERSLELFLHDKFKASRAKLIPSKMWWRWKR